MGIINIEKKNNVGFVPALSWGISVHLEEETGVRAAADGARCPTANF